MTTNPSARAVLSPIDRLRALLNVAECSFTFPELRDDLAAKLEADARPDCPTRGSVAGQVFAIVNELERSALLSLRERDGQFWVVRLQGERTCDGRWLPRWYTPIESLECAHDWGLL